MSVRDEKPVQEIEYAELREKLEAQKQVLSFEIDGRIDPESLAGIVLQETIVVNQRRRFPDGEEALLLGTFRFEKGSSGEVEISNEGTDGFVVADTVQFVATSSPTVKRDHRFDRR